MCSDTCRRNQQFSRGGTTSISITGNLLEIKYLSTIPDLLNKKLRRWGRQSVVQPTLQVIPMSARMGEPLQRQAGLRWGEPGGLGRATYTLLVGSWQWAWTILWIRMLLGSGVRARRVLLFRPVDSWHM